MIAVRMILLFCMTLIAGIGHGKTLLDAADKQYSQIAAGGDFTCGLAAKKTSCWGRVNAFFRTPSLKETSFITSGSSFACAIDSGLTSCWGSFAPTDGFYSALGKTQNIAISGYTREVCGIGEQGVVCWNYAEKLASPPISNVLSISVGSGFACAITSNAAECWRTQPDDWNYRDVGQTNVPPLQNPRKIVASLRHACALDDTGVKCWGSSLYGATLVPTDLQNPSDIAVGSELSCAITGNKVRCWGGDARVVPEPSFTNPTSLTIGSSYPRINHVCVVDGGVPKCWGINSYGESGPSSFVNPKRISSGYNHRCIEDDTGIHCSGSFDYADVKVPVLHGVKLFASGFYHMCAVMQDSTKCWGATGPHDKGQTLVPNSVRSPSAITAGEHHTCVIQDKSVICWGDNSRGQTNVPTNLVNPTSIQAGSNHTCVIDEEQAKCWGDNAQGQCDAPSLSKPTKLQAGWGFSCALDLNGARCWGKTVNGEYKSLANTSDRVVKDIASNIYGTCATTSTKNNSDNALRCWNMDGNLYAPYYTKPKLFGGAYSFYAIDDKSVTGFSWGDRSDLYSTDFMFVPVSN